MLAPNLLGCRLAARVRGGRRWRVGLITEVEAYPGGADRASHTFGGRRTKRNESMWKEGGHAYVYFVYGMHFCLNVVSGPEGSGEAVLIRALEPLEGLDDVVAEKGIHGCRGPAKLAKALDIDRRDDGAWLLAPRPASRGVNLGKRPSRLRLLPPDPVTLPAGSDRLVVATPRVGVSYAGEWASRPWRFVLERQRGVRR
ncbi:MAG: DNA-3-methyladenine glycosylase [Phycisphaerae bacterium]|nr:DNA-3-methyladenine glycosylase [Phycisphaerae bacterium]